MQHKIIIALLPLLFFAFKAEAAAITRPMMNMGLVGYWDFDSGQGGDVVYDRSGNKNHGTATNMNTNTAWTSGKVGGAMNFDGVNDVIILPVNMSILQNVNQATISAWVKPKAVSSGACTTDSDLILGISMGNGGADLRNSRATMGLCLSDEFWVGARSDDNEAMQTVTTSDSPITLGAWRHVIGVIDYSADLITLYLDGQKKISNTVTFSQNFTSDTPSVNSAIGSEDNGLEDFFDGLIDEVRIYNRALSAEEIKRLYNIRRPSIAVSPRQKLTNGLVGYWTFDGPDMVGDSIAKDVSGNNNNGTLTNGPKVAIGKIGQALEFDSVDDFVSVVSSASLNPETAITISFWVNVDANVTANAGNGIVTKSASTDYRIRPVSLSALQWLQGGGAIFSSSNNILVPGQWVHVVLVSSSDGGTFYKNTVPWGSTATAYIQPVSSASLNIGSQFSVPALTLDDVRIYNRALSSEEINRLYHLGATTKISVTHKDTLTNGLVGHWTFDGPDMVGDSIAKDVSGNNNNGTLTNGPKVAIGKIGQALEFDGVDDYVNASSPPTLDNVFVGGGTVSAWIYSSDWGGNNVGRIVNKASNNNGRQGWYFAVNSSVSPTRSLVFYHEVSGAPADSGEWVSPADSISLNTWQHVVLVFNKDSLSNDPQFYINGSAQGVAETLGPAGTAFYTEASYAFETGGHSGGGRTFDGLIDDVRIYNRALTPDEVKRLYNMGR